MKKVTKTDADKFFYEFFKDRFHKTTNYNYLRECMAAFANFEIDKRIAKIQKAADKAERSKE